MFHLMAVADALKRKPMLLLLGNIQADGRKFLGHFMRPFWAANIIRITQITHLPNEANICNKSDFDSVCEEVSPQYTIDCFDVGHQHSGSVTVTPKLD